MRFCLKINNCQNIYNNLFKENANDLIKENYFPGNDISEEKIYEVYSEIKKNLIGKSNEHGCYICICQNGPYLHWIKSQDGFPTIKDRNTCKFCKEKIGYETFVFKKSTMRERNNYFRIFENDESLQRARNNEKQNEGNFMTLDSFWKNYVCKILEKEGKGIAFVSQNHFLKIDKCIRNLSQITYRILNYILFSNLLFANTLDYINKNQLEKYGVENISCLNIIKHNWNILKKELNNNNVDNIEIFMNFIFKEISESLSQIQSITSFKQLINIEYKLDQIIKDKIKNYNSYKNKYENFNKKFSKVDICSINNLIKEQYDWKLYNRQKYQFLNYFYYTKYPSEEFIKKVIRKKEREYPIINAYLERNKNEIKFLKNLSIFNKFHNLLINQYSFRITRTYAKKKILKNEEIYKNNQKICDDFIKKWNNIKEKDSSELKENMPLEAFLIDDDNNKGFVEVYKEFIKIQNKILLPLLEEKIRKGIFKDKEMIPIQNSNENEILSFNLDEYNNFDNLIFTYSIRNIFDMSNNQINYNNYMEYNIDLDKIEEILTDLFLSNKKLFKEEIMYIIYKNDNYDNKILSKFIETRQQIELNIEEKKYISSFYTEELNSELKDCLLFLKEIEKLMNYLNKNNPKENSINRILGLTELNELKKIRIFFMNRNNDEFTVGKIYSILNYFELLIFEKIKNEIKKYQIDLIDEEKEKISKYFENNDINIFESNTNKNKYYITKEKMSIALRRLITRHLIINIILEDDDETIQESKENIVKYLKSPDLWDEFKEKFEKLKLVLDKEIKSFNICFNKILSFYEFLDSENIELTISDFNNEQTIINNNNNENNSSFISNNLVNDLVDNNEDNFNFEER